MRAPPESFRPIDRCAVLHGQIHDFADLLCLRLGQGAAEHGEILRVDVDQPPVDGAVARHYAVAEDLLLDHAEVVAAVRHKAVKLDKAALIQQQFDPLPRSELALFVLLLDAIFAAAEAGTVLHLPEAGDFVLMGHEFSKVLRAT